MADADLTGGTVQGGTQGVRAGRWDKLTICNQALINTGNLPVTVADDGTDEWRVASSAFDQWLEIRAAERTWPFATVLSPPLQRLGDSAFPGYADVFQKPDDCLFLVNVWRSDFAALILPALGGVPSTQRNTMAPPLDYRIIGDAIHTTATDAVASPASPLTPPPPGDFTPVSAADPNEFTTDFAGGAAPSVALVPGGETSIVAMYVPFPTQGQPWSVGFVASLRLAVEATIFQALNEDQAAARQCMTMSEQALERAISRDEQQQPRRVGFRSHLIERRRGRFNGYRL